MQPKETRYITCPDCHSITYAQWGHHFCITKRKADGTSMGGTVKLWDAAVNAWVVREQHTVLKDKPLGIARWDTKTCTWLVDDDDAVMSQEKEKTYEVSSCEVPTRGVRANETWDATKGEWVTKTPSYTTYEPAKPWEGVDRTKWPNTWMKLVQMYHDKGYWGKYISNEEYRDRILRGIYIPEKKPVVYGGTPGGYGNYSTANGHWPRNNACPECGIFNGFHARGCTKFQDVSGNSESDADAGNPYKHTYWGD